MRPILGITTYDGKSSSDLPIAAVQTAYVNAILQAGGVPVLLPNQLGQEEWRALVPRLNGILLTGGGDIAPEHFSGAPHPKIDDVDEERDALELALLRYAAEQGLPFLGICRGCQVVNVALGGTLYTHIPDQVKTDIRHNCYPDLPRTHLAHSVHVAEDSQIAKIFGETSLQVNSLHHQGLDRIAPALTPVACARDGLVEAIELPGHPFGYAVQWHPEWLTDQQPTRSLFKAFVAAAQAG
ncbi:MAG: gamma-glutamyl-gamma-aminobutyrate hydrolase family protein [Anaerolineales bacterium]|jgi:putative glutamine amidotransferase|nr:gamma-glutamyl-gamma-aminobutyrate hydrolase family protein [Anaerolineales bacterium]